MTKLNCDMGESFGIYRAGNDEEIMPLIDVANVACGFHASDPNHIRKTVELAKKHKVKVGAHPSFAASTTAQAGLGLPNTHTSCFCGRRRSVRGDRCCPCVLEAALGQPVRFLPSGVAPDPPNKADEAELLAETVQAFR